MIHEVTGFEQIHLHTTEGSLLDGFGFVKEYAQHWKSHGKYLCITDHGMMSAIPNQIKECGKNGLTPIFGCELYVNPLQIQYATDKEFKDYQKTLDPEQMKLLRRSFHLLAIAHSDIGYSNLVTLTSLAWTKGFYYRPRVNHELLKQYKEGITFTSCCYMSEVGQAFDKGGEEAGFAMIEKYMAMFGEHYKLEFMLLDFVKQKPYNQFIMKAREKYGLPIIVTNDCHYCKQEDSLNQRLMLMVQTKNTIGNMERKIQESGSQDFFELQDTNLWMKTEDEMNAKWESSYSDVIDYEIFKQAKRTTVEICQMAGGLKLDRSMKFPQIDHANEKLKELALKGFKRRNLPTTLAYKKRLQEEFELIFSKGFSSYFLVLKTAVDEARRYSLEVFGEPNAIGPGRGSAVGSLVCYCLGITNVDPIKHDLLFSRFLSKARNDYPDVDLDFIPEVRDYLKNEWAPKYFGTEYVTNIGSYNRFGIKGSLQDMARVYDQDHHEITALTKKLGLKDDEGDLLTWDKAMVMYPELKAYCDAHEDVAKASKKMLNRSRSMGKHAGGIIISSVPINKFVPLVKGKEGEVVSAWTEGLHDQELGPMGFIKYDWLVITNLVQINYACKIIKERHGLKSICAKPGQEDFSDDSFIEDEKALAIANEGDLKCIFQFDSDGIRNLVKKGGVDCFNDLVAYASLYRPGPMSEGMHDEYCLRKRGEKEYTIHPLLATKGDLQKTYGVISYQEQCMKILHVVGDIPLEDCEILRKAISKKKEEYFAEYKVKFLENGVKNLGWPVEEVENLWNQIEAFAGYAFNLSHACAYTYISSMLLWLKAHYPLEFFTAVLHFEKNSDKIKEYRLDARRHDIRIQPLDLNKSKLKFDIVDDQIYIGFSNIKGIGEPMAEKIVANQPYKSFSDFLHRCGADESVLKPLIGLRVFKDAKVDKLYTYYKWYRGIRDKRLQRKKRFEATCEKNIESAKELGYMVQDHNEIVNLEGNEELQELVKKHNRCIQNYYKRSTLEEEIPGLDNFVLLPDDEQPEMDEKLLSLYLDPVKCEIEFYGFIWHHPICKSPDYEGNKTFDNLRYKQAKTGRVEVLINSVSKTASKKGNVYWLLKIEDENGEEVMCQVWEDDWDRFKDDLIVGQLVKMEVKCPDGGFNRYSLNGPMKWRREYDLPKTRKADFRVFVLAKPEISD